MEKGLIQVGDGSSGRSIWWINEWWKGLEIAIPGWGKPDDTPDPLLQPVGEDANSDVVLRACWWVFCHIKYLMLHSNIQSAPPWWKDLVSKYWSRNNLEKPKRSTQGASVWSSSVRFGIYYVFFPYLNCSFGVITAIITHFYRYYCIFLVLIIYLHIQYAYLRNNINLKIIQKLQF